MEFSLHLLVIVSASEFIHRAVMSFRHRSCNTWYVHADNFADVLFIVFTGLTLGLMSLSILDLEVLAKSGEEESKRCAGK